MRKGQFANHRYLHLDEIRFLIGPLILLKTVDNFWLWDLYKGRVRKRQTWQIKSDWIKIIMYVCVKKKKNPV